MKTKCCNKCHLSKNLDEFYSDKRAADGTCTSCKLCCKERGHQRYMANRDAVKAKSKKYYQETSKTNPKYKRTQHLRERYGLTEGDIERMLVEQGGCAICHRLDRSGHNWNIDHDHECCPTEKTCGKCIRGILCHNCNLGLGNFRDNPKLLEAALTYLTKPYLIRVVPQ